MNALIALAALQTPVDVTTRLVDFKFKGETFEDFHAAPAVVAPGTPTVLIIHDWNGIDDHERGYAIRLAQEGYRAIAVDVYGKGVRPVGQAACSAEAQKYSKNPKLLHARLGSRLRDRKTKFFAIGFCFGGTAVLEMARQGMNVVGVASFHGGLKPLMPAKGAIKSKVLVMHGEADPFVPPADVEALRTEMASARADLDFVSYPGAVHSFTVPSGSPVSSGAAYHEAADKASHAQLLGWLKFFR